MTKKSRSLVAILLVTFLTALAVFLFWDFDSSEVTTRPTPGRQVETGGEPVLIGSAETQSRFAPKSNDAAPHLSVTLKMPLGFPLDSGFLLAIESADLVASISVRVRAKDILASIESSDEKASLEVREPLILARDTVSFELVGLASSTYVVTARRVDRLDPFVASNNESVKFPESKEIELTLKGPPTTGMLAVSLSSMDRLASAQVNVFDEGGVLIRSRSIGDSFESSGRKIRGTFIVPSNQDLVVRVTSYSPGWRVLGLPSSQSIRVLPSNIGRLDFMVPVGTPVSFRTIDRYQESLPFALSVWRIKEERDPIAVQLAGSVSISSGGKVWATRLLPGRYIALSTPTVNSGATWKYFDVPSGSRAEQIPVVLTAGNEGFRLKLMVMDANEEPLSDLHMNLNGKSTEFKSVYALNTKTDEMGRIVTPPMPRGQYQLIMWDLRWATELSVGDSKLQNIRVPPQPQGRGVIEGRIALPSGDPVYAVAHVQLDMGNGWSKISERMPPGEFRFSNIPEGSYEIRGFTTWFSGKPALRGKEVVLVRGDEDEGKSISTVLTLKRLQ